MDTTVEGTHMMSTRSYVTMDVLGAVALLLSMTRMSYGFQERNIFVIHVNKKMMLNNT